MVRLKSPSVSLDNVHPMVFRAIGVAGTVWGQWKADLFVTAANEEGHTTNPDPWRQFHRLPDGTCKAVDLRTHNLPVNARKPAADLLRQFLMEDYPGAFDVLHEAIGTPREHVHVEYDPK